MRKFWEKSLIGLLALYTAYMISPHERLVLFFLISIIISIIPDLLSRIKARTCFYTFFLILCLYNNNFIPYLPLILYSAYADLGIYTIFALPFLLLNFSPIGFFTAIISIYLASSLKKYDILLDENKIVRDELKGDTLYLQKYNEQLRVDKEKNIEIAILTERNRIARELHDSIGHGISSSILQVEALKFMAREDRTLENLDRLQTTLKNGMDDIRTSIHKLYRESLDLELQIENLRNEMPAMDLDLTYKVEGDLSYNLKFDILSLVKEGITNAIKHSNGTELKISILEQPKFYSVIIKDNGNVFDEEAFSSSKGMGLISIKEIAYKYNGFVNFRFENGFKIHLTLMKG